jgi:hypothetical protein
VTSTTSLREVGRQARPHERRGDARRRAVDREVGAGRAVRGAQGGRERDRLELRAEADAGGLVEPRVGPPRLLVAERREARERLEADDAAAVQLDDGLEDGHDGLGHRQERLDLQALGAGGRRRRGALGVVLLDARAAAALGDLQRGRGELDEVLLGAGLARRADEAGRAGQAEVGREHALDGQARALGEVAHVRGLEVAQEQDELVPAQAGHGVGVAHRRAQGVGGGHEDLVAAGVPALVVDAAEAVEPRGRRRRPAGARGDALGLAAQLLVQRAVVRQAGERVGGRGRREALALVAEEGDGAVERVREVAELAGALGLDAGVEVARLQAADAVAQAGERGERGVADDPRDPGAEPGDEEEADPHGDGEDRAAGLGDRVHRDAEDGEEDQQPEGDRDGHLDEEGPAAVGAARGRLGRAGSSPGYSARRRPSWTAGARGVDG